MERTFGASNPSYLPPDFPDQLKKSYANEIDTARQFAFKKLNLSNDSIARLSDIAVRIISGEVFPQSVLTGVVVAGFGANDIFPALRTFSPHLMALNRLIYQEEKEESFRISHDQSAALIPFAQKDVADAFLKGIDRRYLQMFSGAMAEITKSYPQLLVESVTWADDSAKQIALQTLKKVAKKTEKGITSRIKKHLTESHLEPLLDVIGVLPKDELAAMAEAR